MSNRIAVPTSRGRGRGSKKRARSLVDEAESSGSEHDDVCALCLSQGELLLCDKCPRAWHLDCASVVIVPEGEWECPLCVRRPVTRRGRRGVRPGPAVDYDVEQAPNAVIRTGGVSAGSC